MTVAPDIEIAASDPEDVSQYLGLSPAQRYELASRSSLTGCSGTN